MLLACGGDLGHVGDAENLVLLADGLELLGDCDGNNDETLGGRGTPSGDRAHAGGGKGFAHSLGARKRTTLLKIGRVKP